MRRQGLPCATGALPAGALVPSMPMSPPQKRQVASYCYFGRASEPLEACKAHLENRHPAFLASTSLAPSLSGPGWGGVSGRGACPPKGLGSQPGPAPAPGSPGLCGGAGPAGAPVGETAEGPREQPAGRDGSTCGGQPSPVPCPLLQCRPPTESPPSEALRLPVEAQPCPEPGLSLSPSPRWPRFPSATCLHAEGRGGGRSQRLPFSQLPPSRLPRRGSLSKTLGFVPSMGASCEGGRRAVGKRRGQASCFHLSGAGFPNFPIPAP